MEGTDRSAFSDDLVAAGLACLLTLIWSWRDWADLSALRLPDSDDMMRLQQIRDWLAGQAFSDLTQYRLGANGVAMHWSRLADLVPGGVIWTFKGLIGQHQSELVAVIVWPALLLFFAIALVGRIGRLVGGEELVRPVMIIASIAFPASTTFLPGRIDHHGLQLVLLLVTVLALLRAASIASGAIAGVAIALSLIVGMEMAPILAAAAAISVAEWVIGGRGARVRLAGFGVGLGATTVIASLVFRSIAWDYAACDGFTAIAARATLIAALLPIVLSLIWNEDVRIRAAVASLSAALLASAIALASPQCLSPYGAVNPLLRQLWLSRVAEAQGLITAPPATALGYAGLAFSGLAASAWLVWRMRARGWLILFVLQLAAVAVMVMQLRGAYAGALLAAPSLGALVVAARRLNTIALAVAWALSAGMFYPLAAQAMVRPDEGVSGASCTAPDLISALGRLPPGLVMAPIDTGAAAIASSNQRLIAGAYHRDGKGDLAMYAFYRGSPDVARAIAERLQVRWVVACSGFGGVSAPFASQLEQGSTPDWLRQVARVQSGGRIFTLVARRA